MTWSPGWVSLLGLSGRLSGSAAVVSTQSNGHRWPGLLRLLQLSWQSGISLAPCPDGPLQHSDHQLVLCQHQGGPGGNMVLSFELWPLVEKYASM